MDQAHRPRDTRNTTLPIATLLLAVMGWGLYRLAATEPLPAQPPTPATDAAQSLSIDPDTAPWWELTVIPGIGEVTARKIVDFREARRREYVPSGNPPYGDDRVFSSPADLQQVKGIGPKTVQRMAPYLSFGPQAVDADRDKH